MLAKILANKIHISGPINFREFMDLSLYESNQGYYTKNNIGPRGDFITSPSVHPLFGSLIGKQIIQIWELMDKPNPFYIYEFGGAPGTLAHDLTNYCSLTKPEFLDQLKYIIIDPSPISERNIAHFSSIKNLTEIHKQGCIISNELLDSLPTRRFKKIFNSFKEIFIDIHDEKLEFKFVEITDSKLLESLNFNYQTIPDGSIIEFNDKLSILAKTFDTLLEKGLVLTIDYGFNSPNIKENIIRYNSFRCYYNHNSDQNPLINIGNKDMTYDIDFNLWNKSLESVGFKYYCSANQSNFLINLGLRNFIDKLRVSGLSERDLNLNRKAILDLIKPDGLGRFTVQAHSKNLEKTLTLDGFSKIPSKKLPLNFVPHL